MHQWLYINKLHVPSTCYSLPIFTHNVKLVIIDFSPHLTTVIAYTYTIMKVLLVGFILLALGLVSAVPQWPVRRYIQPSRFSPLGKELNDEIVKSQIFPLALIPVLISVAPQVISVVLDLVRMVVCNNTANSQLQAFADNEEENAKIMALVSVMNDLLAAEEKLNEIKQLKVQNNLIAEAELFSFDSILSKLKSAITNIGSFAKNLLCDSAHSELTKST